MGLDQYLSHNTPDYLNPGINFTEIAYWRKDWDLHGFINSGNCESILVTEDLCNDILEKIDLIYSDNDRYRDDTYDAFMAAKELIQRGEEVFYEADW